MGAVRLYYVNQHRLHEALAIFQSLYEHMLLFQHDTNTRAHKGMPLVYISECYQRLNCPVLAKRYVMLTLCEDAIAHDGTIPAGTTGIYFRLVWIYGMNASELARYSIEIWRLFNAHPENALFPEWILQELDQQWIQEYPSLQEAAYYVAFTLYIQHLLAKLGAGDGKALERLGHYLLSVIPGCRALGRRRSHSTDYDIVCTLEGHDIDFRSDLGRYFICECKDWKKRANFTAFAKFCRVLDSAKCRFGIVFSREGISGGGKTKQAEREQLKVFQDRGMVIVVVSKLDLERLMSGVNFITMLREKYEDVRLDLRR